MPKENHSPAAWSMAQVHQILRWAEDGELGATQVRQLQALAPLCPARQGWHLAAERFCTWAGAILLAAALIFFLAWNWDDLGRFGKFALAAAALGGCVLAAWRSAPGRRAWQASLLGALLCTGALLALIGQTYQTGADIWELFFVWGVLMLPFVLLARAWPTWLLWLLVSDCALVRVLEQDALPFWLRTHGVHANILLWLGFHILCWWGCVRFARQMLHHPVRILERLSGGVCLVSSALFAIWGVYVPASHGLYLPLFGLLATGAWRCYRHVRLDIPMLGMLGACLILVGCSLLERLLGDEPLLAAPLMTVFVIWSIARLTHWIRRLRQLPDT